MAWPVPGITMVFNRLLQVSGSIGMENRIDRILIVPERGDLFSEQLANCVQEIEKYILWTGSQLVQQSFFINAENNEVYLERYRTIQDSIAGNPVKCSTSIIAQPPARGHEITVELILLTNPSADLRLSYSREGDVNYTVLSSTSSKEIYVGGISPVKPYDPFVKQVEEAFMLLDAILKREGMFFSDISRQWNYVEGILTINEVEGDHLQNYQVLNDVRSRYYEMSSFDKGYPAGTGIGINAGGILLEIYAVKPHQPMQIVPIENPIQVNAYDYSEEVLVGNALEHNKKKSTPKFERAKFVGRVSLGTVYISGTASIQNEKTIGDEDIAMQARISMENISNLIDRTHLSSLGIKNSGTSRYKFIRVYIKNRKDVALVISLCDDFYKDIPLHYLLADVCRDNLLIEIEGVVEIS
ncbi:MAG: hypothetical protein JW801_04590 [Bacteroidales bacterium]|nr:hypothetical protein [Bacteroidales bacterium]